jgi:iron(III) transport system substrate-binding protein
MTHFKDGKLSRRGLLQAGTALAAVPLVGFGAPQVMAQTQPRKATKVLDFETYADVAKAEQEGALVFYCHENEAGTAAIMEGFHKDFPKINTSYVRAQTGALYNKIVSERSAGRFDVDILQLSDIAPALDFQKKEGYAVYVGPESDAYKADFKSNPQGSFFWTGTTFAGIAYNNKKVSEAEAPKTWKDVLNPKWKGTISCKISSSGVQYVAWYMLRQLYGPGYWKEYAKLTPKAFDSRVQLYDRLAKGDDKVCSLAEYAGYSLYKEKTQDITMVMPPDGLPATPCVLGAVNKAPHPEAAKLFMDWAMSKRGQAWYQNHPNLIYGSVRSDAPPMKTGAKLSDFKLLFPTDYDDYAKMRDTFTKEWNGMLGL